MRDRQAHGVQLRAARGRLDGHVRGDRSRLDDRPDSLVDARYARATLSPRRAFCVARPASSGIRPREKRAGRIPHAPERHQHRQ
eukprot:scaffold326182_cov121-Tisochrysis_lutea.AAC.1